jgi:hypothetical protein
MISKTYGIHMLGIGSAVLILGFMGGMITGGSIDEVREDKVELVTNLSLVFLYLMAVGFFIIIFGVLIVSRKDEQGVIRQ